MRKVVAVGLQFQMSLSGQKFPFNFLRHCHLHLPSSLFLRLSPLHIERLSSFLRKILGFYRVWEESEGAVTSIHRYGYPPAAVEGHASQELASKNSSSFCYCCWGPLLHLSYMYLIVLNVTHVVIYWKCHSLLLEIWCFLISLWISTFNLFVLFWISAFNYYSVIGFNWFKPVVYL